MRESFRIIIYMGWVSIHGVMGENIKGNGRIIRWTDKVIFSGLMEGNMWVTIQRTKNRALGSSIGLMVGNIRDNG
jgi:hypothetical protein